MKILTVILLALVFIGVGYLVYDRWCQTTIPSSFQVAKQDFAADLRGRSVTLPTGQLWGFNTDQKITTKFVSSKAIDGNVVVFVSVKAAAKIAQTDEKTKKPAPPKTPKILMLEGLVKMVYERPYNQWHLIQVDGVSLFVTLDDKTQEHF